jgi:lipid A 3-O-deacylase
VSKLIRKTLLVFACFVPLSISAHAQLRDDASILTFQDENSWASLTTPRDHFYTNGLLFGYTSPTGVLPDSIADLSNAIWGHGVQRISFDVTQQIHTPTDTGTRYPNPRDQPYSGILLGNLSLISDTANTRNVSMLSLGVIGPDAGARNTQNNFHDMISRAQVNGWYYQIPNQPAIELLQERTWRLPLGVVGGLDTDLLPALTLGVGNVRDYAQAGVTVRAGRGLDSDFGVPRLRPGLSGGNAYTPTRPIAWYVFAGMNGQAVAYDGLLPDHPGPHVTPIWDVGEFQTGVAVMAFGLRLTVAYVAQTQEFVGQRYGIHQFGSISVSVRF